MNKIRFGRTELMVSKVALGGIPLQRVTTEESTRIVREAIALGVNFIDTAHAYLDSEEKIGKAIRGIPREELVLTTKSMGQTWAELTKHFDNSLQMLGVDYVDIFQLHNINSQARFDVVYQENGSLEWLQKQIKAGKIRFPGFSSHNVRVALKVMKTGSFDVVQLPLNFIDREAEQAVNLARELDMGFISMKPMGGGLLTNAGSSFRYLMQFDSIVPDPGVESVEQIREIIAIMDSGEALSEADKAEIARIREELGSSWCHRCDYCQPCSQGIPISGALTARSAFNRYSVEGALAMSKQAITLARTCTECGDCLSRCPYHLDIPTLMKENISFYDSVAV